METQVKTFTSNKINGVVIFLITLFLLLFVLTKLTVAAPAASGSAETTGAMKQVLNELKSGKEDSAMGSILMIAGIGLVVVVALYMSFKGDDRKKVKSPKTA